MGGLVFFTEPALFALQVSISGTSKYFEVARSCCCVYPHKQTNNNAEILWYLLTTAFILQLAVTSQHPNQINQPRCCVTAWTSVYGCTEFSKIANSSCGGGGIRVVVRSFVPALQCEKQYPARLVHVGSKSIGHAAIVHTIKYVSCTQII